MVAPNTTPARVETQTPAPKLRAHNQHLIDQADHDAMTQDQFEQLLTLLREIRDQALPMTEAPLFPLPDSQPLIKSPTACDTCGIDYGAGPNGYVCPLTYCPRRDGQIEVTWT